LIGKKRTGRDGDDQLDTVFNKFDVERIKKDVVIDGNIVTATCPAAAQDFGKAIIQVLKSSK